MAPTREKEIKNAEFFQKFINRLNKFTPGGDVDSWSEQDADI